MTEAKVPSVDEMAELESNATPGPWVARLVGWTVRAYDTRVAMTDRSGSTVEREVANQEFISAARSFVPWAIERLSELEAENAKLRKARAAWEAAYLAAIAFLKEGK